MTIPGTVRFADPLSSHELEAARIVGRAMIEQPPMNNKAAVELAARLAEAQRWVVALADAYSSDTARMRLAELAIYRAGLLADDMESECAAGKTRRAGPPSPEGIANMARGFVKHYVDPVLPLVREMTGYEDGAEREGWYLEPEEIRARLVGEARTRERLAREGRSMP